jgi:hypothetical protein
MIVFKIFQTRELKFFSFFKDKKKQDERLITKMDSRSSDSADKAAAQKFLCKNDDHTTSNKFLNCKD